MKLYTVLIIGWLLPSLIPWPVGAVEATNSTATATTEGVISVKDAGAKADGVTDDTAAIQKALDQAGTTGGRAWLPPARYLVKGSLRIPPGVTLQGVTESPVWTEPLNGSIILATSGRDSEEGPAVFELGHSSAVRGVTVFIRNRLQRTYILTPGRFICKATTKRSRT
jgi:hypothetical protein